MMPTQPRATDIGVFADRLLRLARLDTSVFEEVRQDPGATIPSVAVVLISTIMAGLGGWLWLWREDYYDLSDAFVDSIILGTVFSLALWIVWLLVAWTILTQIFRSDADWQQMLRTMGLAALPFAFSFFMFVPGLTFGIGLSSIALLFGLTTVAIQSTTNASGARVLVANICGFAVWAIVLSLLVSNPDLYGPALFLFDA
jgi:hypothetical protein